MIELALVFMIIAALIVALWASFFKDPADARTKAALIEAASDSAAAGEYVRKVFAKENLQKRHCRAAYSQVRAIVEREEAERVVESFNAALLR